MKPSGRTVEEVTVKQKDHLYKADVEKRQAQ